MENAFKMFFTLIPFLILRVVSIADIEKLGSMSLELLTTIETSTIIANGPEWELYFST